MEHGVWLEQRSRLTIRKVVPRMKSRLRRMLQSQTSRSSPKSIMPNYSDIQAWGGPFGGEYSDVSASPVVLHQLMALPTGLAKLELNARMAKRRRTDLRRLRKSKTHRIRQFTRRDGGKPWVVWPLPPSMYPWTGMEGQPEFLDGMEEAEWRPEKGYGSFRQPGTALLLPIPSGGAPPRPPPPPPSGPLFQPPPPNGQQTTDPVSSWQSRGLPGAANYNQHTAGLTTSSIVQGWDVRQVIGVGPPQGGKWMDWVGGKAGWAGVGRSRGVVSMNHRYEKVLNLISAMHPNIVSDIAYRKTILTLAACLSHRTLPELGYGPDPSQIREV